MSKRKGSVVNILRKHKLNTGSSTVVEMVSLTDVLGMIIWCEYFMEARAYTIEHNILSQEKNSTILLVRNRIRSAEKKQETYQE